MSKFIKVGDIYAYKIHSLRVISRDYIIPGYISLCGTPSVDPTPIKYSYVECNGVCVFTSNKKEDCEKFIQDLFVEINNE